MSLPRDLKVEIPGPRHRQDQRRLRAGRARAHARRPSSSSPACAINHVINVHFGGFWRGGQRRRLRLRRHRPALLQRLGRVRVHRRPAGLPAHVRAQGAPVRALPPRGHRPRARGAPAGLPAPGQAADRRSAADRQARPAGQDLRPQHEHRHGAALAPRCCGCSSWRCSRPTSRSARCTSGARSGRATWRRPTQQMQQDDATSSSTSRTRPGPRGELEPQGQAAASARSCRGGRLGLEDATGFGKDQAHPGGAGGRGRRRCRRSTRRCALQRLACTPARRACTSCAAPTASATAPTGWSSRRGRGRRVLRPPGHHLEEPADPRGRRPRRARSAAAPTSSHYDGDRLRLVAWRTPKAVYWISNTLLLTLDEKQMMAIARSARAL